MISLLVREPWTITSSLAFLSCHIWPDSNAYWFTWLVYKLCKKHTIAFWEMALSISLPKRNKQKQRKLVLWLSFVGNCSKIIKIGVKREQKGFFGYRSNGRKSRRKSSFQNSMCWQHVGYQVVIKTHTHLHVDYENIHISRQITE